MGARHHRLERGLALMDPAVRGGTGIRVGHPDSGFTNHFALGSPVDQASDWDVIDNDDDATDPLRPPPVVRQPLPNPGHGTSTASIILGRGDGARFSGVAPAAALVSFRATESVVQVFDSDVADAVRRARLAGCHVVSMSLGGTGFFGLREAIQEAVDAGMIVMAAAGNQVGVVTAPASYDNCIAVAATGTGDSLWPGSSRGAAVDVSAPGSCVWAALFDWTVSPPGRILNRTNGTSYAVAHLAGVAGLWLAHHGHAALMNRTEATGFKRHSSTFSARRACAPVRRAGTTTGASAGSTPRPVEPACPIPPPSIESPRSAPRPAQCGRPHRGAHDVTPPGCTLDHTLQAHRPRAEPTDSQASWPGGPIVSSQPRNARTQALSTDTPPAAASPTAHLIAAR
jgi:hypothetical protein